MTPPFPLDADSPNTSTATNDLLGGGLLEVLDRVDRLNHEIDVAEELDQARRWWHPGRARARADLDQARRIRRRLIEAYNEAARSQAAWRSDIAELCLMASETLDRDHLDTLAAGNMDPQNRRLRDTIARRRSELEVLCPTTSPRWSILAPATAAIRAMRGRPGENLANADQIREYLENTFEGVGVDVTDPVALYAVLVSASTMVELGANGARAGEVAPATVVAIARIAQSMTAGLLEHLPAEVLEEELRLRGGAPSLTIPDYLDDDQGPG